MSRQISTFFGVGLLPWAPGTWGSLAALLIGWGIERYLGFWPLVLATLIATVAGFWACHSELRDRPTDDPSEIVIDEVAGMWLAMLFPAYGFYMRDMSMVWPGWAKAGSEVVTITAATCPGASTAKRPRITARAAHWSARRWRAACC